ncbi:hypothetical protein CA51_03820 [Rosistilla oblonga]|nr:hypothetical protein CA51_03820 [Rosistilla oblonga]
MENCQQFTPIRRARHVARSQPSTTSPAGSAGDLSDRSQTRTAASDGPEPPRSDSETLKLTVVHQQNLLQIHEQMLIPPVLMKS